MSGLICGGRLFHHGGHEEPSAAKPQPNRKGNFTAESRSSQRSEGILIKKSFLLGALCVSAVGYLFDRCLWAHDYFVVNMNECVDNDGSESHTKLHNLENYAA
jgi:hypothetical protein